MQHHLPPPILPPHIPPDGQQPVRIGARLRVRDRAGSFWFSARLLDRTEGAWLVGEPEREYREWIPLEDTEERVEIDDSIEPKQVSEDIRSQENFALFAERLQQSLPCSKYQRFHLLFQAFQKISQETSLSVVKIFEEMRDLFNGIDWFGSVGGLKVVFEEFIPSKCINDYRTAFKARASVSPLLELCIERLGSKVSRCTLDEAKSVMYDPEIAEKLRSSLFFARFTCKAIVNLDLAREVWSRLTVISRQVLCYDQRCFQEMCQFLDVEGHEMVHLFEVTKAWLFGFPDALKAVKKGGDRISPGHCEREEIAIRKALAVSAHEFEESVRNVARVSSSPVSEVKSDDLVDPQLHATAENVHCQFCTQRLVVENQHCRACGGFAKISRPRKAETRRHTQAILPLDAPTPLGPYSSSPPQSDITFPAEQSDSILEEEDVLPVAVDARKMNYPEQFKPWKCQLCTFSNDFQRNRCDMCSYTRHHIQIRGGRVRWFNSSGNYGFISVDAEVETTSGATLAETPTARDAATEVFFHARDVWTSNFLAHPGESILFHALPAIDKEHDDAVNIHTVSRNRRRMVGVIVAYNEEDGFGWIQVSAPACAAGSRSAVFFLGADFSGLSGPFVGQEVVFAIEFAGKHPWASAVRHKLELKLDFEHPEHVSAFDNSGQVEIKWFQVRDHNKERSVYCGIVTEWSDGSGYIQPENGAEPVHVDEQAVWTSDRRFHVDEPVRFTVDVGAIAIHGHPRAIAAQSTDPDRVAFDGFCVKFILPNVLKPANGFGFVHLSLSWTEKDFFFHRENLIDQSQEPRTGDRLQFELDVCQPRPRAVHVRITERAPSREGAEAKGGAGEKELLVHYGTVTEWSDSSGALIRPEDHSAPVRAIASSVWGGGGALRVGDRVRYVRERDSESSRRARMVQPADRSRCMFDGFVESFKPFRNFGFINFERHGRLEQVFFHRDKLCSRREDPRVGSGVRFELDMCRVRPRALNVEIVDANARLEPFAEPHSEKRKSDPVVLGNLWGSPRYDDSEVKSQRNSVSEANPSIINREPKHRWSHPFYLKRGVRRGVVIEWKESAGLLRADSAVDGDPLVRVTGADVWTCDGELHVGATVVFTLDASYRQHPRAAAVQETDPERCTYEGTVHNFFLHRSFGFIDAKLKGKQRSVFFHRQQMCVADQHSRLHPRPNDRLRFQLDPFDFRPRGVRVEVVERAADRAKGADKHFDLWGQDHKPSSKNEARDGGSQNKASFKRIQKEEEEDVYVDTNKAHPDSKHSGAKKPVKQSKSKESVLSSSDTSSAPENEKLYDRSDESSKCHGVVSCFYTSGGSGLILPADGTFPVSVRSADVWTQTGGLRVRDHVVFRIRQRLTSKRDQAIFVQPAARADRILYGSCVQINRAEGRGFISLPRNHLARPAEDEPRRGPCEARIRFSKPDFCGRGGPPRIGEHLRFELIIDDGGMRATNVEVVSGEDEGDRLRKDTGYPLGSIHTSPCSERKSSADGPSSISVIAQSASGPSRLIVSDSPRRAGPGRLQVDSPARVTGRGFEVSPRIDQRPIMPAGHNIAPMSRALSGHKPMHILNPDAESFHVPEMPKVPCRVPEAYVVRNSEPCLVSTVCDANRVSESARVENQADVTQSANITHHVPEPLSFNVTSPAYEQHPNVSNAIPAPQSFNTTGQAYESQPAHNISNSVPESQAANVPSQMPRAQPVPVAIPVNEMPQVYANDQVPESHPGCGNSNNYVPEPQMIDVIRKISDPTLQTHESRSTVPESIPVHAARGIPVLQSIPPNRQNVDGRPPVYNDIQPVPISRPVDYRHQVSNQTPAASVPPEYPDVFEYQSEMDFGVSHSKLPRSSPYVQHARPDQHVLHPNSHPSPHNPMNSVNPPRCDQLPSHTSNIYATQPVFQQSNPKVEQSLNDRAVNTAQSGSHPCKCEQCVPNNSGRTQPGPVPSDLPQQNDTFRPYQAGSHSRPHDDRPANTNGQRGYNDYARHDINRRPTEPRHSTPDQHDRYNSQSRRAEPPDRHQSHTQPPPRSPRQQQYSDRYPSAPRRQHDQSGRYEHISREVHDHRERQYEPRRTPEGDSYQNLQRESYQNPQRESYQNPQRESYQNPQRESYQNQQRESYQNPQRESSQNPQHEPYQNQQRESSQNPQRGRAQYQSHEQHSRPETRDAYQDNRPRSHSRDYPVDNSYQDRPYRSPPEPQNRQLHPSEQRQYSPSPQNASYEQGRRKSFDGRRYNDRDGPFSGNRGRDQPSHTVRQEGHPSRRHSPRRQRPPAYSSPVHDAPAANPDRYHNPVDGCRSRSTPLSTQEKHDVDLWGNSKSVSPVYGVHPNYHEPDRNNSGSFNTRHGEPLEGHQDSRNMSDRNADRHSQNPCGSPRERSRHMKFRGVPGRGSGRGRGGRFSQPFNHNRRGSGNYSGGRRNSMSNNFRGRRNSQSSQGRREPFNSPGRKHSAATNIW
eukprot:192967_1